MHRANVIGLQLLTMLILAVAISCDRKLPISEYNLGYAEGVEAAREAAAEGELKKAMYAIGMTMRVGKVDESKSGEWNSGFRKGWEEELSK